MILSFRPYRLSTQGMVNYGDRTLACAAAGGEAVTPHLSSLMQSFRTSVDLARAVQSLKYSVCDVQGGEWVHALDIA